MLQIDVTYHRATASFAFIHCAVSSKSLIPSYRDVEESLHFDFDEINIKYREHSVLIFFVKR